MKKFGRKARVVAGAGALIMLAFLLVGCSDLFNKAPIATINATPVGGKAPLQVSFTAKVSDDGDEIASYEWTFGDGASSFEKSPVHTYETMGVYTVALEVADDGGKTGTATQTINVTNPGPICDGIDFRKASGSCTNCNLPYCAYDSITFSAKNPHHLVNGKSIASYKWSFGNGTTGSGSNVNFAYGASGVYTITLTITDDEGVSNTYTTTITIEECCNRCLPKISISSSGCRKVDCQMNLCGQFGNDYYHGCENLTTALAAKSVIAPENYCGHRDPCDCPDNSCNNCGCRDGQWEWRVYFTHCGSSCETIYNGRCIDFTPTQAGTYAVTLYYTCNGKSTYASTSFNITP